MTCDAGDCRVGADARPGRSGHFSLDGRRFRLIATSGCGAADTSTLFDYHEESGVVWARYGGGAVGLGFLVGRRTDSALTFRYSQISPTGETAGGVCESTIEALSDGRLRLHEQWSWESRDGAGRSSVEEMRSPPCARAHRPRAG